MKTKTKTVITFEACRRTVVSLGSDPIFIRCGFCGVETAMFLPNEFARLQGVTPRQIYREVEAGTFHYIENADGSLLICGNSAPRQLKGE